MNVSICHSQKTETTAAAELYPKSKLHRCYLTGDLSITPVSSMPSRGGSWIICTRAPATVDTVNMASSENRVPPSMVTWMW